MAKLGNVVQMNTPVGETSECNIYGTIYTYLARAGQNSENTKSTYERHIRDFFRTMRNKELENLVESDLIFTPAQVEAYQVALKEKYKGATVNNAMTAIKEVYKKLERNGLPVESNWFSVERYSEHDKEPHGDLSRDEIIKIMLLVRETRKGKEKELLIRLGFSTGFRKSCLLNLKWSDIEKINDTWFIKGIDKGKKESKKKLTDELHEVLMEHKKSAKDDKIFHLSKTTIENMMDYIRENIDFGNRHIVFHSIRKASVNEVNLLSGGDIKAIQQHANHANAQTTINDYIAQKSLEDLIAIDTNVTIPIEKFD